MTVSIPLVDLQLAYRQLKEEIDAVVLNVLAQGSYILGPNVAGLEREVAGLCGTQYGIGVGSGTDALVLSLQAGGVGAGDEVITTPFTFFATAGAIARVGARPVFVDIEPRSLNMDLTLVPARITPRTRAIIPVHLFGRMVDMDTCSELARQYNLLVVEDACQAIGAAFKGRKAGSLGHAGCLSFFPTKNLGGCGDGGMVVTNDPVLAEKVRLLRVHGSVRKYHHREIGCNSRLDELQAAIVRVKLAYLERWNGERRALAGLYNRLLAGSGLGLPEEGSPGAHVYHLYTIRCPEREKITRALEKKNIAWGVYYPLPLHLQEAFAYLGYRPGEFPAAEKASREVLSLPLYPGMNGSMVRQVAETVLNA